MRGFDQTPVSRIFDAIGCVSFFVLWAEQHRCTAGSEQAISAVDIANTASTAVLATRNTKLDALKCSQYARCMKLTDSSR